MEHFTAYAEGETRVQVLAGLRAQVEKYLDGERGYRTDRIDIHWDDGIYLGSMDVVIV